MGFLGRSFGPRQEPLHERAAALVQSARAMSAIMSVSLLERFPILQKADVKHGDFIFTIAGVFIATTRLKNLDVGDSREERLMEIVVAHLAEWKPDGPQAFDDCYRFFETEFDRLTAAGYDPLFIATDALGLWITWNILGKAPETPEECMLVRASGTLVVHAFFEWWHEER